MNDKFIIKYTRQRKDIKKLLLNHFSLEKVNSMTDEEIETCINDNYICYECGEDWLLISKEEKQEFDRITDWICR